MIWRKSHIFLVSAGENLVYSEHHISFLVVVIAFEVLLTVSVTWHWKIEMHYGTQYRLANKDGNDSTCALIL